MTLTFVWQKNVTRLSICKVSYESKKTEGAGKESSSAGCNQRRYEQSVVAWTDAVVKPLAVMVEVSNALVARTTVFRLRWSSANQQRRIMKTFCFKTHLTHRKLTITSPLSQNDLCIGSILFEHVRVWARSPKVAKKAWTLSSWENSGRERYFKLGEGRSKPKANSGKGDLGKRQEPLLGSVLASYGL